MPFGNRRSIDQFMMKDFDRDPSSAMTCYGNAIFPFHLGSPNTEKGNCKNQSADLHN